MTSSFSFANGCKLSNFADKGTYHTAGILVLHILSVSLLRD